MFNSFLKIIAKVIEWLIFFVLLVVFFVVVSPRLPFKQAPKAFIVSTGSMEPTINPGSIVFTQKIDPTSLNIGDIIAFSSPDKKEATILHRISAIKSQEPLVFQTKGDNNNSSDSWDVASASVLGKHRLTIPYLGHVTIFTRQPLGFILIIIFPSLLFIISQIFNIKKQFAKEISKGIEKDSKNTLKQIIFVLLFSSSFVFLATTSSIRAVYQDSVLLSGISLSVKDFIPPATPTGLTILDHNNIDLGCNGIINQRSIIINWDDNSESDLVYYQLDIKDKDDHARPAISSYPGTIRNQDGDYKYRVRAVDSYGNVSLPTDWCYLTLDRSVPTSDITSEDDAFTSQNFTINYDSSPDTDFVQLCYSFNMGDWICDPVYIDYPNSPGSFSFDSPQGDGLYDFYTLATDEAGNTEDDTFKPDSPYSVQVDSLAPTSAIDLDSLPSPIYTGQNLLVNGDFESSLSPWIVDPASVGDHQLVGSGNHMLQIGFSASPLVENGLDAVYQTVYIPAKLSTNLSFSYRFLSDDTADYDQFSAKIIGFTGNILENILTLGNVSLAPGQYDSDWRQVSRSLLSYAGQTIKLWFGLTNRDLVGDPQPSWAFIDNVVLSTLDTRVGETSTVYFDSHDVGSGLDQTPVDFDTQVGENTLDFYSTDNLGNVESTHSSDILVNPPVVLNKIYPAPSTGNEAIELFNNSSDDIDLNAWTICDIASTPHCLSLSQIISAGSTLSFSQNFFLNNEGDTVNLKNDTGDLIDSFTYTSHSGTGWFWQRSPDGIGIWALVSTDLGFNLLSRPSVHKITLSLFSIPPSYDPVDNLDYEIIYTSLGLEKGIFGQVNPAVVTDGKVDYDFYLGTCSTAGVCTPEAGIGSTLTVNISGSLDSVPVSLTKTFNY